MLGRSVELEDAHGVVTRGTVTAIQVGGGTPLIVVNGLARSLGEVVSISPAAADPVIPPASNTNPLVTVAPRMVPPVTIVPLLKPHVTINP